MKSEEEKVIIPGVSERMPKYWRGQLIIYFCNYCQEAPVAEENQIVVSVGHDACAANGVKLLRQLGSELLADSAAQRFAAEIELKVLKKDLGLKD